MEAHAVSEQEEDARWRVGTVESRVAITKDLEFSRATLYQALFQIIQPSAGVLMAGCGRVRDFPARLKQFTTGWWG